MNVLQLGGRVWPRPNMFRQLPTSSWRNVEKPVASATYGGSSASPAGCRLATQIVPEEDRLQNGFIVDDRLSAVASGLPDGGGTCLSGKSVDVGGRRVPGFV